MYEIQPEHIMTIPFGNGSDHEICSKLVRLSVDSKRKQWPMAWGENTADKPVVNIRIKEDTYIVGGELGFFYDDSFVVIVYDRKHRINRRRNLLTSGDGEMRIDHIYVGPSPKPTSNTRIGSVSSRALAWNQFILSWAEAEERILQRARMRGARI